MTWNEWVLTIDLCAIALVIARCAFEIGVIAGRPSEDREDTE